MNNETPNPDWVAWLARAECEACGEDDMPGDAYYAPERPDRGWQRLGDVAAKVVAAMVGGGVTLMAGAAVIYALRVL